MIFASVVGKRVARGLVPLGQVSSCGVRCSSGSQGSPTTPKPMTVLPCHLLTTSPRYWSLWDKAEVTS